MDSMVAASIFWISMSNLSMSSCIVACLVVFFLLSIFRTLLDLMIDMKVDLIVIEGVGRSIHSNFNAKFKCQSLKLAVIKVMIISFI